MELQPAGADSRLAGPRVISTGVAVWPELADPFAVADTVPGASGPVISSAGKSPGSTGRLLSDPVEVTDRYLVFAVAGTDFEFSTCVNVLVDDQLVRSDTGRDVDSLRTTSVDLAHWLGRSVRIELRDQSGEQGWVAAADFSFAPSPHTDDARMSRYREPLRPRIHFTARQWAMDRTDPVQRQEGWLNDLNGLVRVDGEYHLFAQRWNKCWIHAVSTDLLHWTELAPAFFEDTLGSGVQSGSCVLDVENTSGLGDGTAPPMVAFWSGADNSSQCRSFSTDRGRTWTHDERNPILVRGERDPMVFRDTERSRWCMVLYREGQYDLLLSDDLLHWTPTGAVLGDGFECPDFFELPVDDSSERRWVLIRGDGRYSVGSFDGQAFVPETDQLTVDPGPTFYATQSWDASTEAGSRRVQVAWMRGSTFPQMPFSQQVSIPCDLALRRTPDGIRLHRSPVGELASLERQRHSWADRTLDPGSAWSVTVGSHVLRLRCRIKIDTATTVEIDACGTPVTVTAAAIGVGDCRQPTVTALRSLDLIIDTASVEVFANDGEASLTAYAFAGRPRIEFRADGGTVEVAGLSVVELDSIWHPVAPDDR